GNLALGALDGVLRVDLKGPEVLDALDRRVLAEDVLPEQPGQAVNWIGGGEHGALALRGAPERGHPGHDGLADTTLATEEDVLQVGVAFEVVAHRLLDVAVARPVR